MEANWQDSNGLAPLGIIFLLVMGGFMLSVPRRWAMVPLLATVCYIPLGQQIIVAGLHFPMLRLLILTGFLRLVIRQESFGLSWNKIDKLFIWWALLSLILGTLSKPSASLFINRAGQLFNCLGVYLLVSAWVRDSKTLVMLIKCLAFMAEPVAVLMIVEKFTSHNVFSVFGGVPAITIERGGHLRCQAAFRHPILAGTFGATLMPLFVGLWLSDRQARKIAVLGAISAVGIAVAASSGGALLTLVLGAIGFLLWKIRERMRTVRRSIVVVLLLLTVVMNAPVWYLLARVSSITGGTGWHRAWLIDVTIEHFHEWALFGTTYTAHWGGEAQILDDDPDNIDITNQFVSEGVRGGVVKLGLFIALIVACFKAVGRRIHAEAEYSLPRAMLFWTLGVTLFTHCVSFWSALYFDQLAVIWFWLLAAVARVAVDEPLEFEPATETSATNGPAADQPIGQQQFA